MSNQKITDLSSLSQSSLDAAADFLLLVDSSNTSMSTAGFARTTGGFGSSVRYAGRDSRRIKMVLELSKEEAQQLLDLLDLATKAGGLQAAAAALPIASKIMQSVQNEQKNG